MNINIIYVCCLSRMMRKYHVRFLEGKAPAMGLTYSTDILFQIYTFAEHAQRNRSLFNKIFLKGNTTLHKDICYVCGRYNETSALYILVYVPRIRNVRHSTRGTAGTSDDYRSLDGYFRHSYANRMFHFDVSRLLLNHCPPLVF